MVCPHGQGGLSQCGHFEDKGGVNFSRFCADVFYGRALTTLLLFEKILEILSFDKFLSF